MNASIGKAILEIAIDTAGINAGVSEIKGQLSSITGMAGTVGKALAAAFTVTAVAALGRQVLDFAGELTDLSQQTSISTTTLQKWGMAFKQSGVDLETVTKAAGELAARIVGGDKSTVGALKALGLNVEQLKGMSIEQQFNTVADAVGGIQNKSEQLYASKTLFGKSGVELLKGLTGNLQETTAGFEAMGLVMDEQTVAAADQFGDQIGLMGQQLMALVAAIVGPLLPALSLFLSVIGSVGKVVGDVAGTIVHYFVAALLSASSAIMKFLALILDSATRIPFLGKYLGVAGDAANWLREKAAAADTQLVKMFTATDAVGSSAAKAAGPVLGLGKATHEAAVAARGAAEAYEGLVRAQNAAAAAGYFQAMVPRFRGELQGGGGGTGVSSLPITREMMYAIPSAGANQNVSQETFGGGGLFSGLGDAIRGNLSSVIMSAFQGGGSVGKSAGGLIGGKIGESIVGKIGSALSSKLGGTIGGAIGSVIPGLGTFLGGMAGQMIGPLIGKLGGLFKSMFGGPSQQEVEGRQVAAQFRQGLLAELQPEQMAEVREALKGAWAGNEIGAATVIAVRDAYLAAGKSAEEAHAIVDRLWRAEKEGGEAVQDVIAEIQVILDRRVTPAFQDMGAAAVDAFAAATEGVNGLKNAMRFSAPGSGGGSESGGGSIDWNPVMFDPETGSYVQATFERWEKLNPGASYSQFREAFNLDVVAALRAAGITEETANAWAQANGGDQRRIGRAFGLPGFAEGGLVTRPTLGVFGEAGAEVAAPLDRLEGWIDRVGRGGAASAAAVMGAKLDRIDRTLQLMPQWITAAMLARG